MIYSLITLGAYFGDGDAGEAGGDAGGGGGGAGGGFEASGDTGVSDDGGNGGQEVSAGFDWKGWDGSADSVPAEHKGAYEAIQERKASGDDAQLRNSFVKALEGRYSDQNRTREKAQAERLASGSDTPLTEADMNRKMSEMDQQRAQQSRVDGFHSGMKELVGGIHKFGETSASFTSEAEVSEFQSWMQTKIREISPMDMFKLWKHDSILKGHGDAVVRNFEKNLGKRQAGIRDGTQIRTKQEKTEAPIVGDGGVLSLEEYLTQANPTAMKAINAGKLNPLDSL